MAEETTNQPAAPAAAPTTAPAAEAAKAGGKSNMLVVVLVIAGILLVGGGVAFKMFIMPPSSKKVCEHAIDIMEKSLVDDMGLSEEEAAEYAEEAMGDIDKCVEELDEEKEDMSWKEIKEDSDCILDAEDLDDLSKCE